MSSATEPSPRGRVLTAVEEHNTRTGGSVTAAELAGRLGLHPSTVRFHLRRLVESGQIVEESGTSPTSSAGTGADSGDGRGRPRKQYLPAPCTPKDSLLAALVEALADSDSEREDRAAQAGRIWASTVTGQPTAPRDSDAPDDPLDAATRVLTALGFEVRETGSMLGTREIRVCSCPLRILGQHRPEVARGIQRGIVEQALAAYSGRPTDWKVTSRPDPRYGDCEVALRFNPATPAGSSPPATP